MLRGEKVLRSVFILRSFVESTLQVFGRPQWLTVKGRSQHYVNKVSNYFYCVLKAFLLILS